MNLFVTRVGTTFTLAVLVSLFGSTAYAAEPAAAPPAVPTAAPPVERLFLSLAEDPALAQRQWWEGQFEYADGSSNLPWDRQILRLQAAVAPWKNLEIGGRVGFGTTQAPQGIPDGSGATDTDVYAKWNFGSFEHATFAAGGLLTVPTGDESAGLGFDAFAVKIFGALRYPLAKAVFTGNVGVRFGDDGRLGDTSSATLDAKTSVSVGFGLIVPMASSWSLIGEAALETERFDGLDSDLRILGGVNWRPSNRGVVRAAAGFGLSDVAPDIQIIAGYAFTY